MSDERKDSLAATVDVVRDLVKSIEDPYERAELVERLIFEIITFGTDGLYSALGVLEKVKFDYINIFYDIVDEEYDGEDDEEENVN